MEDPIVTLMDTEVFKPLRNYLEKELKSTSGLKKFIQKRGMPEKCSKNQSDLFGFILEEYFKRSLEEYCSQAKTRLIQRTIDEPIQVGRYRLEGDRWGNITVYRQNGTPVCEIDSVCEYGFKRIPVLFEVTSRGGAKNVHTKRKVVGMWYNQRPFSCRVRFYRDKDNIDKLNRRKFKPHPYYKGIQIPQGPKLDQLVSELTESVLNAR